MISEKEIKHIAQLARLKLTDNELDNLQKDLSAILDYVAKLQQADVASARPAGQIMLSRDALRQDTEIKRNEDERIVAAFPEREGRLLKVKSIFQNGIK